MKADLSKKIEKLKKHFTLKEKKFKFNKTNLMKRNLYELQPVEKNWNYKKFKCYLKNTVYIEKSTGRSNVS